MISEERLKELLKEETTIYRANGYIEEIYLTENDFEVTDKELVFNYKIYAVLLEDLFETEEETREYLKYGNVTRTEKFPYVSYDEMRDKLNKKQKVENYYYYVKHFYKPNRDIMTDIDCTFSMYLMPDGHIIIDDNEKTKTLFSQPLTRENYHKALDLAIRLWKGEEE